MPRLFHGPDCFTVSTCCTYIDLGSRGYFGVNVALVYTAVNVSYLLESHDINKNVFWSSKCSNDTFFSTPFLFDCVTDLLIHSPSYYNSSYLRNVPVSLSLTRTCCEQNIDLPMWMNACHICLLFFITFTADHNLWWHVALDWYFFSFSPWLSFIIFCDELWTAWHLSQNIDYYSW